jgi:hypothetical protein
MSTPIRTAAAVVLGLAVLGARLHADVIKLTVEKRSRSPARGSPTRS